MAVTKADTFGQTDHAMPSGAIVLTPNSDVQSIVSGSPNGSTFWFEAGTYHLGSPIVPKDGQTFIGAKGAVLDGGTVLKDFTQEGSHFVASNQTQEGERYATDQGAPGAERAGYPETVFVDGKPLTPVDNMADLKSGHFFFDYGADKIYLADDPNGHVVEAGRSPAAFQSNASNVTVSNFVVEHFNSPTQYGAIRGDGPGWTVENNEVRFNYGVGITVRNDGVISGNNSHDNGQMGVGATGTHITVEHNELGHNGYWSGINPNWEGGGSKFGAATDLVVRDNYTHDNHGYGLWTDESSKNVDYEGNLVVNNDGGGISHEISYDATIRDNTLVGNGSAHVGDWLWGAQIQVQNSQNVEVSGNRVDMSGGVNGIALIQQDRGDGPLGNHLTTGNNVHDNLVVSQSGEGLNGGVADYQESTLLNNNSFANNTYEMSDGSHWRWGSNINDSNWDSFVAASGQEHGSTLAAPTTDTSAWLGAAPAAPAPEATPPVTGGETPPPADTPPADPAHPVTPADPADPSAPATPTTPATPAPTTPDAPATPADGTGAGQPATGGTASDTFHFGTHWGADRGANLSFLPDQHDMSFLSHGHLAFAQDASGAASAATPAPHEMTIENLSLSPLHSDFFLLG